MTMGWTVAKIDEQGREEKKLSDELDIDRFDSLDTKKFKLIKYLDPYGDTTYNSRQLDDLLTDLRELERNGRLKSKLLTELERLVAECTSDVHSCLKFSETEWRRRPAGNKVHMPLLGFVLICSFCFKTTFSHG